MQPPTPPPTDAVLAEWVAEWVTDARRRTLALTSDLTDEQLMGPRLATVNPLRWELGHLAWFQEHWVLRHALGQPPIHAGADALYDSSRVAHDTRWDLPLLDRAATLDYLKTVQSRVLDALASGRLTSELRYFVTLSVFHEDMHGEAFHYTRQTLGYPQPPLTASPAVQTVSPGGPHPGDVAIAGARFLLGSTPDEPFVFDNEKWAHPVEVKPFSIARAPVTQSVFAAFVDSGGYTRREFWSDAGWQWRTLLKAEHPVYWRSEAPGRWLRRDFDRFVPLEPHRPVIHVSWYEAEAFCRFVGRRLPTESEWELAAASEKKRRFPWGDAPPDSEHANLDARRSGCADVGSHPSGDSEEGCRQLIGNVWEWTATPFLPYPGFVADPYKDYSLPWFGDHMVLRGGAFPTRARLLRNSWRNFYKPDRRDIWSGFRTCAIHPTTAKTTTNTTVNTTANTPD